MGMGGKALVEGEHGASVAVSGGVTSGTLNEKVTE